MRGLLIDVWLSAYIGFEIVGQSYARISQFVFPMLHRVGADLIRYIFYGLKGNAHFAANQGFHIYGGTIDGISGRNKIIAGIDDKRVGRDLAFDN